VPAAGRRPAAHDGRGVMGPAPYYDDGQVTLFCADGRDVEVCEVAAAVVTSPPYNVGLAYDGISDRLAWPEYWRLAAGAAEASAAALVRGGRVWVNTAVSVPEVVEGAAGEHSGSKAKRRVVLAHRWAAILETAGLALVDQVAWCSPRGAGTAWGSWASPAAPNLRGDYEAVTVACRGGWERTPPDGLDGWRDQVGGWPACARPSGRSPRPPGSRVGIRRRSLSSWPGGASACRPGRGRWCSTRSRAPAPRSSPPGSSAGEQSVWSAARRTAPRRLTGSRRVPSTSTAPPDGGEGRRQVMCVHRGGLASKPSAPVRPTPRMRCRRWPTLRPPRSKKK
jgi:hypothetical protein